MQHLFKQLKPALVLFVFLQLICLSSCRVNLLPPYSEAIAQEIAQTAKTVDRFYLIMAETTSAKDNSRQYTKYAEQYAEIEVALGSLLHKNKIRPLNENTARICEIAVQIWAKYKKEHKEDNNITDGLILINRTYMADLFFAMHKAEAAKQIIGKTTN